MTTERELELNDPIHERPKILGLRRSAFIEIALFLLVFLAIDAAFLDGDRYWDAAPHPFWIIVILISAHYGTSEGLLAVLAASLALLLGNMPAQAIDQDYYEYLLAVFKNPLMWLTSAVILGELRMKHIRERSRLETELAASREREFTIADAYNRLRELKENLELRIAGQLRSSLDTYRAAKAIETLNPIDVLQGVEELVRSVLNPQQFSVYVLTAKGLENSITHGWSESEPLQRTIDAQSTLYQEVIGRQHTLSVVNRDHEKILAGQGVIAGPLVDRETGEIVGMLKIERMGFLDLNLSTIETFTALCEWVGMSLVNARKYQSAKSDSMVNPDHNLMSVGYFRRYTDYITALAKRVGFDVSMIMVKIVNANQLPDETRSKVAKALGDAVNKTLRSVDLAFDYQQGAEQFAIVLPSTNTDGAKIVLDKIMKAFGGMRRAELKTSHLSYTVHALHAKPAG